MSRYTKTSYNESASATEVAVTGLTFVAAGTAGYHAVNEGVKAIKRGLGYDQDKPQSMYDRSMQAAEDVATIAGAVGGACYLLKMGSGLALEAVGALGTAYDTVTGWVGSAWDYVTGKSAAQAQPAQPVAAQPVAAQPVAAQAQSQPAAPAQIKDAEALRYAANRNVQQYDYCNQPSYPQQPRFNYNCRRP